MQRVKHDFQVANQEILFGNVCMIQNGFTFFRSEFMFKVQTINCMQYSEPVLIGHFRVPKTLTFKMRPSAQPFLWKWVLFAWEWKIISTSKAEHLTSFWYVSSLQLFVNIQRPLEPRELIQTITLLISALSLACLEIREEMRRRFILDETGFTC